MTFVGVTLDIKTLSITTLGIMTFSRTTQDIMPFNIMHNAT
jgi:hypothetical protein